jgi:hypothetical protein
MPPDSKIAALDAFQCELRHTGDFLIMRRGGASRDKGMSVVLGF